MSKILIVEDNKMNAKLLEKMLSQFGECTIAYDGYEALKFFHQQHAKNEPFDIIFLDLEMPNLAGQETLVHIRQYERSLDIFNFVKVVILTGESDKKVVMELFTLGCEHYLTKPVKKEDVVETIKKFAISS